MFFERNVSLRSLQSFGLDTYSKYLSRIKEVNDLLRLLNDPIQPIQILGEGTNLIFLEDFQGVIIKNEIDGIEILDEEEEHVKVSVGGGVNWHSLVEWALEHNYGGLENLALIPGSVGAAPVQNIGAYGVEVEEVIESVEAIMLDDQRIIYFSKEECAFGYRDSIFKNKLKNRCFISRVNFLLSKKKHKINTAYGSLRAALRHQRIDNPSIHDVANVVIKIRRGKLPDPKKLGNCGSFFKNPIVSKKKINQLSIDFPDLVFYPYLDTEYKIPAAWLIDQCGWKGKRIGNIGVYPKQAVVLVNYGEGTSKDLITLISAIQQSVEKVFGIRLEPEVNLIGGA